MNTFAVEIWYDEGNICTFYTVRWILEDRDTESETDKFFNTYAIAEHRLEEEALQLFRLITESIGNNYGATNDFFDRLENNAYALPPKPKNRVEEISALGIHFPLRLYCYRVTEQIVILFNGGIKDAVTAQESKQLSLKFYEAQLFAKRIDAALQQKIIELTSNERYLQTFSRFSEIIL